MPIRFRCVYCNRLLGIARRKAGAIVNCPHCAEKLIVPTPEPEDNGAAAENESAQGPGDDADFGFASEQPPAKGSTEEKALAGGLFERGDFEALLQGKPTFRTGGELAMPPPVPQFNSIDTDPEPAPLSPAAKNLAPRIVDAPPPPPGYYVTPSKAVWLGILGAVLLAVAFAAGLMVARL